MEEKEPAVSRSTSTSPEEDLEVRILVVEDSPTQALLLHQVLETNCYRASRVANGKEALEYLKTEKPAMVITDVVMPEMDGYELCRRIRADSDLRDLPIILLTELSDPGAALEGLKVGANNFISKPFDQDLLISRIKYILANNKIREASGTELGLRIFFAGQHHFLTADRIQIVDFLISSLDSAVRSYHAINRANKLLEEANEKISRQAEQLRALSLTDELTGLNNRRGFFTLVDQQMKIARRDGWEMVLIFADIDDFKKINDTLGHQEGDRALVDVADLLRATFRESDVIGRLGGDEFAVFVAGAARPDSWDPTARLRRSLEELNRIGNRRYELALSLGTAFHDSQSPCSINDMIRQADEMMYRAKRGKLSGNRSPRRPN